MSQHNITALEQDLQAWQDIADHEYCLKENALARIDLLRVEHEHECKAIRYTLCNQAVEMVRELILIITDSPTGHIDYHSEAYVNWCVKYKGLLVGPDQTPRAWQELQMRKFDPVDIRGVPHVTEGDKAAWNAASDEVINSVLQGAAFLKPTTPTKDEREGYKLLAELHDHASANLPYYPSDEREGEVELCKRVDAFLARM